MPKRSIAKLNNVSTGAVEQATGRGWGTWIEFIDRRGGVDKDHKQIVTLVRDEGGVDSGWWQQTVTVGYEHAKGRRTTGETGDAGFQIGAQRSIAAGRNALWKLLTSAAGVRVWLGSTRGATFEPGARFSTDDGIEVEIRTVKPAERVRMTWQPAKRKRATTLQITLSCPRNDERHTTVRFHHEKLSSKTERERMRAHWKAVLADLAALTEAGRSQEIP